METIHVFALVAAVTLTVILLNICFIKNNQNMEILSASSLCSSVQPCRL